MSSDEIKKRRMEDFGEFLKSLRKQKNNVSVREVAKAIGISDPYLYQVENGKKALTDPEFFNRIASYFKIPVEELLKKAGYLQETTEQEKVEKAFDFVVRNPKFNFGFRLKGEYDLEVKRFVVQMYEKLTGEEVLK